MPPDSKLRPHSAQGQLFIANQFYGSGQLTRAKCHWTTFPSQASNVLLILAHHLTYGFRVDTKVTDCLPTCTTVATLGKGFSLIAWPSQPTKWSNRFCRPCGSSTRKKSVPTVNHQPWIGLTRSKLDRVQNNIPTYPKGKNSAQVGIKVLLSQISPMYVASSPPSWSGLVGSRLHWVWENPLKEALFLLPTPMQRHDPFDD